MGSGYTDYLNNSRKSQTGTNVDQFGFTDYTKAGQGGYVNPSLYGATNPYSYNSGYNADDYTDSFGLPDYGSDGSSPETGGFFDSLSNKDMIAGGMGVAQTALGLGNYLENRKFNKARINALDEQITSSKYARGRHQQFVGNTKQSFA